MAEVELLGQDLLDVLPSFDGEAAVGHHEVDALALRLRQDKLFKLEEVVFAENVPVALLAPHSVVSLEALGCKTIGRIKVLCSFIRLRRHIPSNGCTIHEGCLKTDV